MTYHSDIVETGRCGHSHRTIESAARCAWKRSGVTALGGRLRAEVVRSDGEPLAPRERQR